jgi:hypothetical protein
LTTPAGRCAPPILAGVSAWGGPEEITARGGRTAPRRRFRGAGIDLGVFSGRIARRAADVLGLGLLGRGKQNRWPQAQTRLEESPRAVVCISITRPMPVPIIQFVISPSMHKFFYMNHIYYIIAAFLQEDPFIKGQLHQGQ